MTKFITPILTAVVASAAAQAQMFFLDTGTPDLSGGNSVYYLNESLGQTIAQQFTINAPTDLSQIDVFVGTPGLLTVRVTSQIGPGTDASDVLMSFSLGGPVDGPGWTGTGVGFSLNPGTYYMVFSGTSAVTLPSAPPVNIGPTFFSSATQGPIDGVFAPASTFQQLSATSAVGLRIAAVPEPGETAAVTAAGLAGFAMVWRRFRKTKAS